MTPAARLTRTQKGQIQDALAAETHADRIIFHADGTVTVRRGFFYRLGGSSEKLEAKVRAAIPTATIVDADEKWQAWPKSSYWFVRFAPNL